MKKILFQLCFGLTFLLFNCDSSSNETISPTIVITDSQSLPKGGISLTADFQNFSEGDELGFYISNENGGEEYLISTPKIGINTIELTSGLIQDEKYWFYAFIRTNDNVFYSITKEFYALTGSYIPELESISPSSGYIGSDIEIVFSEKLDNPKIENFEIKLHTQDVEIIDIVEDKKIVCKIPDFIPISGYYRYPWAKISIVYLGKSVPCDYEFHIKSPEITSISPKFIDWEGEITIKGSFFEEGYPPNYITVNINDFYMGNITYKNHDEIRVKVSIHMFANNPKIVVDSNFKYVTQETNTFSYYPPEIVSFQQGSVGDEIEIIGKYFWPASYVNEVYFDSYKAEIISGESTKLVVKIPDGTYINNKASLKVHIRDFLTSEPKEFTFN